MSLIVLLAYWYTYSKWYILGSWFITHILNIAFKKLWLSPLLINALALVVLFIGIYYKLIEGQIVNPHDIIDDLALSPAVKRAVWQALRIVDEIVHIKKTLPARIFVEVTRSNKAEKKKKDSRQKRLSDLYAAIKKVGISRSTYYKYKDYIKPFYEDGEDKVYGLHLSLQGYFVDLQQFLTALLNDVPTLSLTQLNIEKLDEEENASITCELIFQLNKDK